MAAGNVGISTLSVGVSNLLSGREWHTGLTAGAFGGALAYSGKRLASARFDGHQLLARQVHALGASLVSNSMQGRSAVSRLEFPFGPIAVRIRPGHADPVSLTLSAGSLGVLAHTIFFSDADIDVTRSLATGIPIFRQDRVVGNGGPALGKAGGGRVVLQSSSPRVEDLVLRHEIVHVLQEDFIRLAFARPSERSLVVKLDWGEEIPDWLELDVLYPAFRLVLWSVGLSKTFDRPLEWEAYFVEFNRLRQAAPTCPLTMTGARTHLAEFTPSTPAPVIPAG